MRHWMLRCEDVSRKVSQSMEATLPLHQRIAIRIHLMMCRHCARFRRQLIALRKISRSIETGTPAEPLSAAAKEDIKKALRSTS